ncbi:uncharacterized protein LOC119074953 isoform X2 [Bradysia coprophila]|uniref:uncharacterized protein LOC119074953 isoform X2 n=1 Tax=Bradysia coprophila TaxID=38358 RepID=UPI00187DBBCE|nr:uncharacterized protein LOC119074953 isoform X2 [Bradysia coprophila]
MSLHNYTNPAFCQQSEFYPNPSNSVPNKSPIKIYRSESVRSFKQTTRIRQQQQNYSPIPPKVGPKPQVNLSNRYAEQPFKNTYEQVNASVQRNATSVEYALVPLTEIPSSRKGRYACIPADDVRQLHQNTTRFTRSQDDLDRFSSLPANVNDHDDSITSLPPCPTQDNPRLKTAFSSDFKIDQHSQQRPHDNSRLQAAFSSDFGNKSFIVVDQNSQQRYEIVPTEEDEELVDANHEIIQMHNGRAHRYAMIPTDDEETCLSSEFEMSPIRNTNNYATIKESPRYQPPYKSQQQRTYVHQSPQKDRPPATPTKNALVTQKLHELLSTPQKTPLQRQGSTLRATPVRHNPPVLSSTPKQTEFTPQKLRYEQHQPNASQFEQRTTAVISPRLASLATYVEPSSVGDNSSWKSLSFQKVTNATATIGAVSLMLILCGIMNSGLCLYMIADFGRIYYLDIGVISGFAATALGILGFKSRQCDWLPNRNYVSVTVFSLLNCCGLLVLLSLRPLPGEPIHDVTTGILLGLSFLTLFMISLGVITSRWCRSPPPDNRVDVYKV